MQEFKENFLNISQSESVYVVRTLWMCASTPTGIHIQKVSQQHAQWLHIAGDEHLICHI